MRSDGADSLTQREADVLDRLVRGRSDKEIASALGIQPSTVSNHVSMILQKLHASSRTEAAMIALRDGLVKAPPPAMTLGNPAP